jgi:hypothetical protein
MCAGNEASKHLSAALCSSLGRSSGGQAYCALEEKKGRMRSAKPSSTLGQSCVVKQLRAASGPCSVHAVEMPDPCPTLAAAAAIGCAPSKLAPWSSLSCLAHSQPVPPRGPRRAGGGPEGACIGLLLLTGDYTSKLTKCAIRSANGQRQHRVAAGRHSQDPGSRD